MGRGFLRKRFSDMRGLTPRPGHSILQAEVDALTRAEYETIERIMRSHMKDSAHDAEHIYRVLRAALAIAEGHPQADMDVLLAACLLHDIGRGAQFRDPSVSHADAGADMAFEHLTGLGWDRARAQRVSEAIRAHRYRSGARPETIEARILYDADKLDVAGAMGVARTLVYQGKVDEPLYRVDGDGEPLDGHEGEPSFMNEYVFKLSKLYDGFFTPEAAEMARSRARAARAFCESLLQEARGDRPLKDRLNGVLG